MVVKALRTYNRAQLRGMGRSAGCQAPMGAASVICALQTYCQDIYKGQLALVRITATNELLRKLAATYTYCNLWIRAVTSCKVTGPSRHPGLGQGWVQDAEPCCHRVGHGRHPGRT